MAARHERGLACGRSVAAWQRDARKRFIQLYNETKT